MIKIVPIFLLFFLSVLTELSAQVYLSRLTDGDYKTDNRHLVHITNGSGRAVNLSGWLLTTRDYVFVFPTGTVVNAGRTLKIAKEKNADNEADLSLNRHPNFKIKLPSDRKTEGNFCALVDAEKRFTDGFYHALLPNVPFLPDSDDVFINNTLQKSFYKLPPENHPLWRFLPVGTDPVISFERTAPGSSWRITSARKGVNPYAVTRISEINARFREGIISLNWTTDFEYGLKEFFIERSENQTEYQTIGKQDAQNRRTASPSDYVFYDTDHIKGKSYFFRLRYLNERNETEYSKPVFIEAVNVVNEFRMEALTDEKGVVSVRFYSAYARRVKIKLFDSDFKEWAILYDDPVYADTPNLLQLTSLPPAGKYLLVASVENKRYHIPIEIP